MGCRSIEESAFAVFSPKAARPKKRTSDQHHIVSALDERAAGELLDHGIIGLVKA